jgi:hypothetical protein
MTFREAMQIVVDGGAVRRPLWEDIAVIMNYGLGGRRGIVVSEIEGGGPGGGFSPYSPSSQDEAATDWRQWKCDYPFPVDTEIDWHEDDKEWLEQLLGPLL